MSLRASELVVFDGPAVIARHHRVTARGDQSLDLDRYLEMLRTKPGALPGASALAAACRNGTFTPAHDAFWAAARKTDGDAGGTRQCSRESVRSGAEVSRVRQSGPNQAALLDLNGIDILNLLAPLNSSAPSKR